MVTSALLDAALVARTVSVDEISGGGDVILLAPHPDDETLGCGGAIAALSDKGRRVQVIVITDGGHSHPVSTAYPRDRLCSLRQNEVRSALHILTQGRGPVPIMLGFPDNAAPDGDAAALRTAEIIQAHINGETALWTTWAGDPHPDHGRTSRIAAEVARRNPRLSIWSYPIWGRFNHGDTTFDRDCLVRLDTEPWQHRKSAAVTAHATQMSGLISDDPGGFRMDDALQDHFITTPELFLKGL